MNIMNINKTGFGAKVPAQRIQILKSNEPGAEKYLEELMEQKGDSVRKMAKRLNKNVILNRIKGVFAGKKGIQQVDALYINSGAKTSRFDLTEVQCDDEIIDAIESNIRLNA